MCCDMAEARSLGGPAPPTDRDTRRTAVAVAREAAPGLPVGAVTGAAVLRPSTGLPITLRSTDFIARALREVVNKLKKSRTTARRRPDYKK